MPEEDGLTVLPAGAACITRPGSNSDLMQVALRHPDLGWIAAEVDRGTAYKLALELQAFADFRSTADEDA